MTIRTHTVTVDIFFLFSGGQSRQQTSGYQIRSGNGRSDKYACDAVAGHGDHVQRGGNRHDRRYGQMGSNGRSLGKIRRHSQVRGEFEGPVQNSVPLEWLPERRWVLDGINNIVVMVALLCNKWRLLCIARRTTLPRRCHIFFFTRNS